MLSVSTNFQSPPGGFWTESIKNLKTNLILNINSLNDTIPLYRITNLRDDQMAENLLWIISHKLPEEKIIVWSASMHNARNISQIDCVTDTSFYQNYIPMGQIIYDSIGSRMYSLAFSSRNGYFQTPMMMTEPKKITSIDYQSIESFCSGLQIKYGIINFRSICNKSPFQEELFSNPHGHSNVKAIWPLVHDGIFYIDTIQPPQIQNN